MRSTLSTGCRLLTGFAALVIFATTASAHHGWDWTQKAQTEMSGTISNIYIGPPHPRLQIRTAGEGDWTVDLGNPRQTQDAGFVEGQAKVGDKVPGRGHRSNKSEEKVMKAVRITINERNYLFYPDLLRED